MGFFVSACIHQPRVESLDGSSIDLNRGIRILVFMNAECPICKKYGGHWKSMLKDSLPLVFVFPGDQSKAQIRELMAYDSVPDGQIISDTEFEITRFYDAKVTPQAIILENGSVRYSGKIDNRFINLGTSKSKATVDYIRNALNSLNKNELVEEPSNKPVGCLIEPK